MASAVVATSLQRIRPPRCSQVCKSAANTWRSSQAQGFLDGSHGWRSPWLVASSLPAVAALGNGWSCAPAQVAGSFSSTAADGITSGRAATRAPRERHEI